MMLPRPLVLFLAFCGGAALFAAPLFLAALALGTPTPPGCGGGVRRRRKPVPAPGVARSARHAELPAFDLGFDPASVDVEQAGRYAVTFVNDGAVVHNITFADGTVIEAEAGKTAEGEVVVPAEGLGYVCSIPGHADGGMRGAISVAGGHGRGSSCRPVAGAGRRTRPSIPIRMRLSTCRATRRRLRSPKAVCTTSSWS